MTTITTGGALAYLATEHGVMVRIDHTGGGNYVIGLGAYYGYDEEQGTDRYAVNLGPVYREPDGTFTGESGDLYAVSIFPAVRDVTFHTESQVLPTLLRMLGIDDVNVSDATVSLDEIATALGADSWYLASLGGNIMGVCRDDGTMITLDAGSISFLPASVTIGRQGPDDEWTELFHGDVWDARTVAEIVADRA